MWMVAALTGCGSKSTDVSSIVTQQNSQADLLSTISGQVAAVQAQLSQVGLSDYATKLSALLAGQGTLQTQVNAVTAQVSSNKSASDAAVVTAQSQIAGIFSNYTGGNNKSILNLQKQISNVSATSATTAMLAMLDSKVSGVITTAGLAATQVSTIQNQVTSLISSVDGLAPNNNDVATLNSINAQITGIISSAGLTNAQVDTLKAGLTAATAQITANQSAVQVSLSGLQTQLNAAISTNTGNSSSIVAIQSSLATSQSAVATLQSQMTAAANATTGNTNNISTISAALATAQSDVSSLQSQLAAAITANTGNSNDIGNLQTALATSQASVKDLQNQINVAVSSGASNSTAISSLQSALTSAQSNVTALQAQVTALVTAGTSNTTNIATNTASISTLQSALTSAVASITSLQSTMTTLQSQVSNLIATYATSASVATLQTQANSIATSVTSNTSAIATLQGQVATMQSQIATLQSAGGSNAAVTALQTQVATLATSVNSTIANQISALQTQVNANSAQITQINAILQTLGYIQLPYTSNVTFTQIIASATSVNVTAKFGAAAAGKSVTFSLVQNGGAATNATLTATSSTTDVNGNSTVSVVSMTPGTKYLVIAALNQAGVGKVAAEAVKTVGKRLLFQPQALVIQSAKATAKSVASQAIAGSVQVSTPVRGWAVAFTGGAVTPDNGGWSVIGDSSFYTSANSTTAMVYVAESAGGAQGSWNYFLKFYSATTGTFLNSIQLPGKLSFRSQFLFPVDTDGSLFYVAVDSSHVNSYDNTGTFVAQHQIFGAVESLKCAGGLIYTTSGAQVTVFTPAFTQVWALNIPSSSAIQSLSISDYVYVLATSPGGLGPGFVVAKISPAGSLVFSKSVYTSLSITYPLAISSTAEGMYITYDDSVGTAHIAKLSITDATTIWDNVYPGQIVTAYATSDGIYAISNASIIKLDFAGNQIWSNAVLTTFMRSVAIVGQSIFYAGSTSDMNVPAKLTTDTTNFGVINDVY